jgi:hypothetical protein
MYLQTYFVLAGEGVVAGKPLERSDWPRRTGMFHVVWNWFSTYIGGITVAQPVVS